MGLRSATLAGALVLTLALLAAAGLRAGWDGPRPATPRSLRSLDGLSRLPWAARGPVSAALGAAGAGYAALGDGQGGWRALNGPQHLRAYFARAGMVVNAGSRSLGIRLRAIGVGPSMRPVTPAQPAARGNQVSYTHPGIREWYANGPLGIEQGFTITRAPAAGEAGPLTLWLGLSGNLSASLTAGGREVRFAAAGTTVLTYTDLAASDASGRVLPAWLGLGGGGVVVHVDTRGARYPVRIDPLVQNGMKLTGAGAAGNADFGAQVALSADGATALIGGPYDNNYTGAAWVFTRSGAIWSQQAKLTAGDETGRGYFGMSVALSSDGNTALIGGSADNGGTGAAWVFTRAGAAWSQQGPKLIGAGATGKPALGASVALSSDGNTALIGGIGDSANHGAAWVFTRTGVTWSPLGGKLTAAGSAFFGASVALSSDGNTALIGAPGGDGAAFVFTHSVTWSQQGSKLRADCTGSCTGPNGTGETGPGLFGSSVALSSDGNTALIGAYNDNYGVGAAWAFTRSGVSWSQQGSRLTGADATTNANFAAGVALSADGNTALFGGPHDGSATGAAWVFTRSGSAWVQQGSKLKASDETGAANFGASVALAADASRAVIGGTQDGNTGAAWVFGPPPPTAKITSPHTGGRYNLRQRVATRFSCTAGSQGPALKSCRDSGGASAPAGKLNTSTVGPHTYTVKATDLGGATGSVTIRYTVVGPPSVTISSPIKGKSYRRGKRVRAKYACKDASGAPGIKSCTGSVRNGSRINTSHKGAHTFTVTATSKDGQRTTVSVHYTVR